MMLDAASMRRRALPAACVVAVLIFAAACTSSGSGKPADVSASDTPTATSTSINAPAAPSQSTSSATHSADHGERSTPVAAPSTGNINETVPSRAVTTEPPVRFSRPASFHDSMSVSATAVKAITATAHGPGEIGGPAVEIVLEFRNSGSHHVNLANTVVTITGTNGDPGLSISGRPNDPVTGKLAPHSSAVGRYVFTLAKSQRSHITISVSYSASAPVVLIVGNAG